ncbi:polysaccharide biosynthesis protein, partial [Staphylococcus capitis]
FKIIFNVIFIYFMGILGASISTVLSLIIFVTILHYEVVKYYRFNRMRAFIVKLMSALIIMSVVIQGLRMLLPPVGRLGSLIELLIIVGLGGLIFLFLVIYMNFLGYKELKHLQFGDKLYRIKKER